ncbi:MAG: 3-phosphoshikimate 1-carboxyvinyltransferase [Flavobacteriales bacterium]|nr:MAG: 3-phosphoshikimate 1-carboxyvinyltransferase [Flavobacteriales bacterium]
MSITISHSTQIINGEIQLTSSKSESNRGLIIQALCNDNFEIQNLSISDDTKILRELLDEISSKNETVRADNDEDKTSLLDVDNYQQTLSTGLAGTAMRFLTAFLAIKEGEVILTGEHRMKERPIKELVNVLKQLGADIEYVGKEGFPPLKIIGKKLEGGEIIIDGSISSQYISALLMIAPKLKKGLKIKFSGDVISKPYINMTISMMDYFGASVRWEENNIKVDAVEYKAKTIFIEADWSAASYWYSMVALAKEADITLYGLKQESLQGDAVVQEIYKNFGVETEFIKNGIRLTKNNNLVDSFEYDFTDCPDIAQTVAITCAALNMPTKLTGLKTLRIKETDRITALQSELNNLGFDVDVEDDDIIINRLSREGGNLILEAQQPVKTYSDHRMAMAFAPLSLLNEIAIEAENVVTKSYPNFWKDLESVGFFV